VRTGDQKPPALKSKHLRGRGRRMPVRYAEEAITLFKARRATDGKGSSFRAIQDEIEKRFGAKPSLSTLERWSIRFDPEIRSLRRALEAERERLILEGERTRLEFLSTLATEAMHRLPEVLEQIPIQVRDGRMCPVAFLEVLISIAREARREQKGERWTRQKGETSSPVGSVGAEAVIAVVERIQNSVDVPGVSRHTSEPTSPHRG